MGIFICTNAEIFNLLNRPLRISSWTCAKWQEEKLTFPVDVNIAHTSLSQRTLSIRNLSVFVDEYEFPSYRHSDSASSGSEDNRYEVCITSDSLLSHSW